MDTAGINDWLNAWPYSRPVLGLLALAALFFLVKAMIRPLLGALKFCLALALVLAGAFLYLDHAGHLGRVKSDGADFSKESEADQTTVRQLYAQIVDAEAKDAFAERAILEGRPFKFLLKRVSEMTNASVRKAVDERTILENFSDEPDLHRGEAYAMGRGVVVEVSEAELTPEYGFPKGWTVLPAVFVNTAREIYALRILCAPGSDLYKKLKKGIDEDKLPVLNMAGLFFKNYARRTGDPKEPSWVRPLMVCPEPTFPPNEEPRQVLKEIAEAGYAHLLPSKRIEAAGAEERLVIEVAFEKDAAKIRAWGEDAGADVNAFVAQAAEKLKKRLPKEQLEKPGAAIVVKGAMPDDSRVGRIRAALKSVGVERVSVKQEFAK